MNFPPKVVASITTKEEAKEAMSLGADIVEVRADIAMGDPASLIENIYMEVGCPIIATIRPEYEGGQYKGTDMQRLPLFKKVARFADYIDVELRASNLDELIKTCEGQDCMPIVSYHDFKETPPNEDMLSIISKAVEKGSIAKLAVTPNSLYDVLRLYAVTVRSNRPVCTIAMGELGSHSRIMAPVYGSLLSYGYVRHPVAPGQIRVDRILEGLKILGLR